MPVPHRSDLRQTSHTETAKLPDVFFTSCFAGLIQHEPTDLYWVSRRESRVGRLAFSYNFGNQKLKNLSQRRSGTEDEQRRSN